MERCHSYHSVAFSCDNGYLQDMCRICHGKRKPDSPLISPCDCSGSLRYVHHSCLEQWIKSSNTWFCELCKFHFITYTKTKPFREWEKLAMPPGTRRKLFCAITIFFFTIVMLVFYLYTLITALYRLTAEGMRMCAQEWPFCTGMILVAISFLSGFVFMYLHYTKYIKPFFRNWRAFNSIIYVQNAPVNGDIALQQPLARFSAASAAQLNGCVLTSEETKRRSSDEDDFYSCQNDNNSTNTSNSHSGSSNSVNVDDTKNRSGEISIAWTCFTKTILTSLTDSGPVGDHNYPLNEVVVTSTDSASSAGERNSLLFLSK